jgi:NAD(P)-dependent dehydrogenase (short-subunit alcohol dehydrogenase family)
MQKRVCLLTGASGTLGTAFCRVHGADYAIAAIHYRRAVDASSDSQHWVDPLDPHRAERQNGHQAYTIQADLNDDHQLERVVELTLSRFSRIDLVVHAAVHSVWANLDSDRLTESFDTQFRVNVRVPFALSNLIARYFWRSRSGENRARNRNVVNISSVAGMRFFPGLGQSVYAASKAALIQLTLHMAEEYRPMNVRVNAVAPNSFPQIVGVEDVVRTIHGLDQGATTGKILVVDRRAT